MMLRRLRLCLRRWRHRPPAPVATPDALAMERRELARWQSFVDALAASALAGDMHAAARLTDEAEGRVAMAKVRMAALALESVLTNRK